MSDRDFCRDCKHISAKSKTGYHTCQYPVPHWALPPQIVDPDRACTCPTFDSQLTVIHVTPAIDENCDHTFSEDEDGQTDLYGACTKCGLSFQRYIHSCCP